MDQPALLQNSMLALAVEYRMAPWRAAEQVRLLPETCTTPDDEMPPVVKRPASAPPTWTVSELPLVLLTWARAGASAHASRTTMVPNTRAALFQVTYSMLFFHCSWLRSIASRRVRKD